MHEKLFGENPMENGLYVPHQSQTESEGSVGPAPAIVPVVWAVPPWFPSLVPVLGLVLPFPMLLDLIKFCILVVIVPPG